MRKLFSILGLVFSCVLAQAAAVNWTNYVPNIQVATNANVANQLQLGTTFTDGHLWPNAPDGTTPWYLEHTVPHTGGNLFQLVDPIGGPYFAITWLWEIQGADLLLTGSAQVQGTVRANNIVATNGIYTGGMTNTGVTVHTPSAVQTLAAGTVIAWDSSTERVVSTGGAVTLTGTPTIQTNNVPDGALITIRGTSDANTVTLQDYRLLAGTCVAMEMSTVTLANGGAIRFQWSSPNQRWQQIDFSANSSMNHKFANLTVQTNATVGGTGGGSLIITNGATATVPLVVNQAASGSVDMFQVNGGGTNWIRVDAYGNLNIADGNNLRPSLQLASDNDGTGTGLYRGGANTLTVACNGTQMAAFTPSGLLLQANTYLNSPSTSTLRVGTASTAPGPTTILAGIGSGTDKPGGDMLLSGGTSTGTGVPGGVAIQTSLVNEASASTANAYTPRAWYHPKFVVLTHGVATVIQKFSLPANKILGGEMVVTLYATNATPHFQMQTDVISFSAGAIGTTITGGFDIVKSGTQRASSGTLTVTGYSFVDNGDNTFSILLQVSSDLSSPTERCKLVVTALNGNAAVTITDP